MKPRTALVATGLFLCCSFTVAAQERPSEYRSLQRGYSMEKHREPFSRPAARVLRLSKYGPITIEEPGVYVLDRSWEVQVGTSASHAIEITADDVVLDLRNFTITLDSFGSTVLRISGDFVTVQNGELVDAGEGGLLISTGMRTVVENMRMGGFGGVELGGSASAIRDSRIGSRTLAVELSADSAIERTSIGCTFYCVDLGDRNRLVDSVVSGFEAVRVEGDGNVLSNNEIRGGLIAIDGDTNIVRGNMLFGGGAPAIGVSGTKNIVDGNLILPDADGTVQVGIEFTVDGNYYGDNRVSAEVPFAHGGTVQTDWGGNVAFTAQMATRSPARNQ